MIKITALLFALLAQPIPDYDRSEWRHWIDDDRDCQNTRAEVLIERSWREVVFRTSRECVVNSGLWLDLFSGTWHTDASRLDIDHMVPLGNAHASGAWAWTRDEKRTYANDRTDPGHLLVVHRSLNRAKGARGPENWRPPNEGGWCFYAANWQFIKDRYGLTMTDAERRALDTMTATCP